MLDELLVKEGGALFNKCQWCHGAGAIAGGGAPDLRASAAPLGEASFATVVRGGVENRGMPKFDELTDRELEALRHYIRARARRVTRPNGVAPAPVTVAPHRARKAGRGDRGTAAAAGLTRIAASAPETVGEGTHTSARQINRLERECDPAR